METSIFSDMTVRQLDDHIAAAQARRTELINQNLATAKERVERMLADDGLTVAEVFKKPRVPRGGIPRSGSVQANSTRREERQAPAQRGRPQRPLKYRNPDNATEGWAGYGPRPKWLAKALAEGKKLEDFAITA